ncbi:hypothetical protein BJ546DRAFT_862976 [Cryomyces antarcticus]
MRSSLKRTCDLKRQAPEQKEHRAGSNGKISICASNCREEKTASKVKDPTRPKRKKAKRACFACQRAHLTCGDERPCQPCIKRGLRGSCNDGMRKKARHLHDPTYEALTPGVGGTYHHRLNGTQISSLTKLTLAPNVEASRLHPTAFFPQVEQNYPIHPPNTSRARMPPPIQETSTMNLLGIQQTSISPSYLDSTPMQQSSRMLSLTGTMQWAPPSNRVQNQPYREPPPYPSDQAPLNLDSVSLNIRDYYGVLQIGLLNHVSSGAVGALDIGKATNPMD